MDYILGNCVHKVSWYQREVTKKTNIPRSEFYAKCLVCNKELEDREIRKALILEFPLNVARRKYQVFLSINTYHDTVYRLELDGYKTNFLKE